MTQISSCLVRSCHTLLLSLYLVLNKAKNASRKNTLRLKIEEDTYRHQQSKRRCTHRNTLTCLPSPSIVPSTFPFICSKPQNKKTWDRAHHSFSSFCSWNLSCEPFFHFLTQDKGNCNTFNAKLYDLIAFFLIPPQLFYKPSYFCSLFLFGMSWQKIKKSRTHSVAVKLRVISIVHVRESSSNNSTRVF